MTTLFTVVNAVLLKPLSYPNAYRLVWPAEHSERFQFGAVRAPDCFDWKARSHSFEKMVPYGYFSAPMAPMISMVGVVIDSAGNICKMC